jgi:energy-coupling factor transport system ATP-binding protein
MIKLKNVTFSYGNKESEMQINNLNLNIQKGEFVLLCGKSGCGKTSILRTINGLIPNYYEGKLEGDVFISECFNGIPKSEISIFQLGHHIRNNILIGKSRSSQRKNRKKT